MAKVSAHGREIGSIEYTTFTKRYMSDGVVLINYGHGWKHRGKIKEGTPEGAFQAAKEKHEKILIERPAFAAYRALLHATTGLSKRWKLQAAIQAMPDDADGVWSEVCDGYGDNVHADLDEIATLCRAYRAAVKEKALEETR